MKRSLRNILHGFASAPGATAFLKANIKLNVNSYLFGVVVDVTNGCNMRCPTCARTPLRPELNAPDELFEKLVSEVLPHAENIAFGCRHEAILHPLLPEHIASLALARDIYAPETILSVLTPGYNLNEPLARRLTMSRLDVLLISIDSTDEQTYAFMRAPATLSDVKRRIQLIAREPNKPKLAAQALLLRLNLPHIVRTMEELAELGFSAFHVTQVVWGPRTLANYGLTIHDHEGPVILETMERLEARAKEIGIQLDIPRPPPPPLPDELFPVLSEGRIWDEHILKRSRRAICVSPWYKIRIDSQGFVFPCFRATHPRYAWGNILHDSFESIVNSERALKMRAMLLAGKALLDVCERCAFGPVSAGWADRRS